MVFGSGLLLYGVRAFERYLDVYLFKEVCDFSDFGTMKCEDGPFLVQCSQTKGQLRSDNNLLLLTRIDPSPLIIQPAF